MKGNTQTRNNRYNSIYKPSNSGIKSQQKNIQQNLNELPIVNSTQTSNLVQSNKPKNNNLNEELINNIWNDLGVNEDYREQFIIYTEKLEENEKK